MTENIGILHPGEMGISVAVCAQKSGNNTFWVSEGRSAQTSQRAENHSLLDAKTLDEVCRKCSIIISVCPPHAAEDQAEQVLAHSFKGIYVDANAISPQRTLRIGKRMEACGISFVDGGIIGRPAWDPGTTWLYLSGAESQRIVNCFTAGPLQTEVLGDEIGKASAIKMCYAANTKGTTALLCAIMGAAEDLEVRDALERHWSREESGSADRTKERIRGVTSRAWRFAGEMDEIASTFVQAGMPGGFHQAAADVYERMAVFKDRPAKPELSEVLSVLRGSIGKDRKVEEGDE